MKKIVLNESQLSSFKLFIKKYECIEIRYYYGSVIGFHFDRKGVKKVVHTKRKDGQILLILESYFWTIKSKNNQIVARSSLINSVSVRNLEEVFIGHHIISFDTSSNKTSFLLFFSNNYIIKIRIPKNNELDAFSVKLGRKYYFSLNENRDFIVEYD